MTDSFQFIKTLKYNLCPKGRKHIARGEAPGRGNTKRTNPEGVEEKRILLIFQEITHALKRKGTGNYCPILL